MSASCRLPEHQEEGRPPDAWSARQRELRAGESSHCTNPPSSKTKAQLHFTNGRSVRKQGEPTRTTLNIPCSHSPWWLMLARDGIVVKKHLESVLAEFYFPSFLHNETSFDSVQFVQMSFQSKAILPWTNLLLPVSTTPSKILFCDRCKN